MDKFNCFNCDCEVTKDHFDKQADEYICDDCYNELCYSCHKEEASHETAEGNYICTSCYSGMCDMAYERWKDRDYD